mmetsp:Transcript_46749/g.111309  ORF Transcript_46749/g.111309 Transcript_46749/m.111309 type:complete len:308 (-) Transcript_46749:370-1293(-)
MCDSIAARRTGASSEWGVPRLAMTRSAVIFCVAVALSLRPTASFSPAMMLRSTPATHPHISGRIAVHPAGRRSQGRVALGGWLWGGGGDKTEATDIFQDGFKGTATESSWEDYSGGVTSDQALACSVDAAADYADTITGYLEETARKGERLPANAAEVVQALLSHSDGVQGFWTAFLTNPDLANAAKPPFDPAIVNTVSRFPELNIGVISNCLALSAVEENLFEDDELMRQSAKTSKERACTVLKSLSRQPSPKKGEHGCNWLLDLVDYLVLEEAVDTIELREEEKRLAKEKVEREKKELAQRQAPR